MNPTPSAMPKAAAIPARLLRTSSRQCTQGPVTSCVRSTSQVRGYHAPTASSANRRLRESAPSQKKHPAFASSRVCCVVRVVVVLVVIVAVRSNIYVDGS